MKLKTGVLIGLSLLLTLVATAQWTAETARSERRPPNAGYQPGVRKHIGRLGDHAAVSPPSTISPSSEENAAEPEISESTAPGMPTRSIFIANWQKVSEAIGYRLDVSTSDSFNDYLNGYHDLDVGNTTSRVVTGLTPGVKYYYRVRAYNAVGTSGNSAVMSAATAGGAGLIINATFDSSILNNPNSAAVEAMFNHAIAIEESLFSDPITVSILFRYTTTNPDGTPMDSGTLGESQFVTYPIPWNTFIAALRADAKTSNDTSANASLPSNALSTNIVPSSAGGRAVGLNTPPAMSANGSVNGGPYDGIVTLNSAQPFQFSRPTSANNYDALRSTEHEMDEVMGLGSFIDSGSNDLRPQDLFSWSSPGVRNITTSGSRYFSINRGNTDIVGFNQDRTGDFGDWLSGSCPQTTPYVQNAFGCSGQFSDVTATSPEGINLDVIGYDLVTSTISTISPPPGGGYPNANTAEGANALFRLTSGKSNTANGYQALFSNTTGNWNTASGVNTLYGNTSGVANTANGIEALFSNTTGGFNTANGYLALFSNTTGGFNTANGIQALLNNTTGSNNIALGINAGSNLTTGDNNIDIGNNAGSGEANTIRIGTVGTQSATFIAGISGTAVVGNVVVVNSNGQLGTTGSSERFKEGIEPMGKASEAILALRPVTYRYKHEIDPEGVTQFGLVAEEVEKVNPDLVAHDAEGKIYSVRYEAVNAMLLNEFLKEHRKAEEQEMTIAQQRRDFQAAITKLETTVAQQEKELHSTAAQQQKEIQALTASLEKQAAQIQKVSAQLELKKAAARVVADNSCNDGVRSKTANNTPSD